MAEPEGAPPDRAEPAPAGIDCAIDAAARALAAAMGVDYGTLHGAGQHEWRRRAQAAVDGWREDRRRTAEESVPTPAGDR